MNSIEFFGIVFRSEQHLHWFFLTLIVFAVVVILLAVFYVIASSAEMEYQGKWMQFSVELCFAFCFSSLFTTTAAILIAAANFLRHMPVNGPVWSLDCIWFNALVAMIYFCLGKFLQRRLPRSSLYQDSHGKYKQQRTG